MHIIYFERTAEDGSTEVCLPFRRSDGSFVMAKCYPSKGRQNSDRELYIASENEVVENLRSGEYCLRMARSGNIRASLIIPDSLNGTWRTA